MIDIYQCWKKGVKLKTDLYVGVELDEAVRPGGSVDLVPVLTVELPG